MKNNALEQFILSAAFGVLGYFLFSNYEEYVQSTSSGLGKVKLVKLIILSIDSIGGRWLVLILLIFLCLFFLIRGIRLLNRKEKSE